MSASYAKTKGMMNRHAQNIEMVSSGDGVSGFAKERQYQELVRRSGTNGKVTITHNSLCKDSRMSEKHSQNTLKSLKRSGMVSVSYNRKYCDRLKKRIVVSTNIIIIEIRDFLKGALNKAFDLTAKSTAQLLYTETPPPKTHSGIAMFRHYSWVNRETGEEMHTSSPELVRCMA